MTDELRDEGLSRLYRETAKGEPPPALDAAILAAAREAVKAERRRPWWRAWALPLSVAATVVLTATLTLMVQQEQEQERAPTEAAPAQAPSAAPAASPAVAEPAATKARKAEGFAPKPAAVEPKPAAAPAPAITAEREQSAPAADAVELRAKSVAPLRKEAAGAATPARAPEQWLEEIRRLKKQGKEQEAAEALAAFGQAYPDYRLPEDLR